MSEEAKAPTKVFISYSWDSEEHKKRVLSVANTLRDPWGIETDIDQYVRARPPFTPSQGWDLWMEKRIEWAEFVLIVCTETYRRRFKGDEEPGKGRGVTWEGTIIRQNLYNDQLNDTKFIPVVVSSQDLSYVPTILNSHDKYILEDTESFKTLVYRLRKEPMIFMPEVAVGSLPSPTQPEFFSHQKPSIDPPSVSLDITQIEPPSIAQEEIERHFQDWESFTSKKNDSNSIAEIDTSSTPRKELQECDSAKILFIKNVKDPQRWAYSLERMGKPESRAFELMWRSGSHGVNLPQSGDLMVLHQRAKVTHVVEFLDNQVRQTDSGFFRWVRAVWLAEQDWNQLPHQKDVLGFSPNYADGNTHSLNSPNFSTFREAWSSLEEFQKYIFKRLTQSQLTVTHEDILVSEKGIDYARLRDLLKAEQWREADQETAKKMCEVMGRQQEGCLRVKDIRQFPCADLRTIDRLWLKYSGGKFGFSVQKRIWEEGDSPTEYNSNWEKIGEVVGWKDPNGWVGRLSWYKYEEYRFDNNAPQGHLPSPLIYSFNFGSEGFVVHFLLSRKDLIDCS